MRAAGLFAAAIIVARGRLAQLGEHQLDKLGVASSSLASPTRESPASAGLFCAYLWIRRLLTPETPEPTGAPRVLRAAASLPFARWPYVRHVCPSIRFRQEDAPPALGARRSRECAVAGSAGHGMPRPSARLPRIRTVLREMQCRVVASAAVVGVGFELGITDWTRYYSRDPSNHLAVNSNHQAIPGARRPRHRSFGQHPRRRPRPPNPITRPRLAAAGPFAGAAAASRFQTFETGRSRAHRGRNLAPGTSGLSGKPARAELFCLLVGLARHPLRLSVPAVMVLRATVLPCVWRRGSGEANGANQASRRRYGQITASEQAKSALKGPPGGGHFVPKDVRNVPATLKGLRECCEAPGMRRLREA